MTAIPMTAIPITTCRMDLLQPANHPDRVDVLQIPHWAPSYSRNGDHETMRDRFDPVSLGERYHPAVSMPELGRIRRILGQQRLFLVVSDAFLSETPQFADVVFPAAFCAEKTGCFTYADRTVHLSEKAVDPPGRARSDFDIWLDYSNRMGLKDKDGAPLVKWRSTSDAWTAFAEVTRGRPCDQSGIDYDKLREGPFQWPCTTKAPRGRKDFTRILCSEPVLTIARVMVTILLLVRSIGRSRLHIPDGDSHNDHMCKYPHIGFLNTVLGQASCLPSEFQFHALYICVRS